jgi:dTDP-4-dehydrorhamnose 3,5-epimerase
MNVSSTALPGVLRIEPRVHRDDRGHFLETFNAPRYAASGVDVRFVLDSVSHSRKGTLRGLHFQEPRGQAKLVQVLLGSVYDVVVDVRRGSPTFGRWVSFELTAESAHQVFIPAGFAHGFFVLSEWAEMSYKNSDVYAPETERAVLWSDPDLAITWPAGEPIVSPKDAHAPRLADSPVLPNYESR